MRWARCTAGPAEGEYYDRTMVRSTAGRGVLDDPRVRGSALPTRSRYCVRRRVRGATRFAPITAMEERSCTPHITATFKPTKSFRRRSASAGRAGIAREALTRKTDRSNRRAGSRLRRPRKPSAPRVVLPQRCTGTGCRRHGAFEEPKKCDRGCSPGGRTRAVADDGPGRAGRETRPASSATPAAEGSAARTTVRSTRSADEQAAAQQVAPARRRHRGFNARRAGCDGEESDGLWCSCLAKTEAERSPPSAAFRQDSRTS